MTSMRFVTFEFAGRPRPGVLSGKDFLVDLSAGGFQSVLQIIQSGEEGLTKTREMLAAPPQSSTHAMNAVRLLAPLARPPKLICVGLNYLDHARETGAEIPKVPTIFNKFTTAVIGPGDNVVLPRVSKAPDFEAEFAFVIGTGGRHIAANDWARHIFGYTIVNDVTARDYQRATTQWLMGKTFDTFAPMGPCIVTPDEIPNPHDLDIQLEISGPGMEPEIMQDSNTRELIFKIPDLIAFLSSVFTLEPGDIVSTGTPAGVGFARKPPRYLRAGEELAVRVEHIGELRNPVVAEA